MKAVDLDNLKQNLKVFDETVVKPQIKKYGVSEDERAQIESNKNDIEEIKEDYPKKTELPTNLSQLNNDVGYITNNAIQNKADKSQIPTKTSQLTNDSNLATKSDIDTAIANLVDSAPEEMNTLKELSDAIKEHEDEYDALLEVVGNKANKSYIDDSVTTINNNLNTKLDKSYFEKYEQTKSTFKVKVHFINFNVRGYSSDGFYFKKHNNKLYFATIYRDSPNSKTEIYLYELRKKDDDYEVYRLTDMPWDENDSWFDYHCYGKRIIDKVYLYGRHDSTYHESILTMNTSDIRYEYEDLFGVIDCEYPNDELAQQYKANSWFDGKRWRISLGDSSKYYDNGVWVDDEFYIPKHSYLVNDVAITMDYDGSRLNENHKFSFFDNVLMKQFYVDKIGLPIALETMNYSSDVFGDGVSFYFVHGNRIFKLNENKTAWEDCTEKFQYEADDGGDYSSLMGYIYTTKIFDDKLMFYDVFRKDKLMLLEVVYDTVDKKDMNEISSIRKPIICTDGSYHIECVNGTFTLVKDEELTE